MNWALAVLGVEGAMYRGMKLLYIIMVVRKGTKVILMVFAVLPGLGLGRLIGGLMSSAKRRVWDDRRSGRSLI